jgi:hypothetical protein
MALFRANPQAGLAKAQAALAATDAKIAELEADRRTALAESDAIEPVHALDMEIAKQRAAAATYADRVQLLKPAVAEQREDERRKQYQAALLEIEKRLAKQVELAGKVEQAARDLGKLWNGLLGWRSAIISGWPASLPLPPADSICRSGPTSH